MAPEHAVDGVTRAIVDDLTAAREGDDDSCEGLHKYPLSLPMASTLA